MVALKQNGCQKMTWKRFYFIVCFFYQRNYSLQGYLSVVFVKQEDEEVNVIGRE